MDTAVLSSVSAQTIPASYMKSLITSLSADSNASLVNSNLIPPFFALIVVASYANELGANDVFCATPKLAVIPTPFFGKLISNPGLPTRSLLSLKS